MALFKIRTNQIAMTIEDKKLLADFINANMGQFLHYCEEQHASEAQLSRLMTFIENNATPFDDSLVDVDI